MAAKAVRGSDRELTGEDIMAKEAWSDFLSKGQGGPDNWWDIWGAVLQQDEQAQYYSAPVGQQFAQQSPSRGRYFQNAYQDIYSDYLGNIGTSMRQGQTPQTFMDYMKTNDPWTSRYSALPQTARGTTGMYTNPRTRFLYNF